ncbi:MAG: addiction module protein [Verrucomicrobiaceae bacterium]|nr:MAG: addiction module protein [Verrucomicrobiaceae bacterium]
MLERHPELRRLSPSEKLALVSELWDDLASHPEEIPITPEQIAELDRRLEAYHKDPSQSTTWEEIRARILPGSRGV